MRHISDKLATADRDEDDNGDDDGDVVDNDEDDNIRMRMRKRIKMVRKVCLGLQNKIKIYYFFFRTFHQQPNCERVNKKGQYFEMRIATLCVKCQIYQNIEM